MPKIAFYTLGCKANQYETEAMKSQVALNGFEITDFHSPSDIYVINTCTVTHVADKKGRQAIRQARRRNPKSKIIVTGCYSEVSKEEIEKIKEVDVIIGNNEKKDIFKYLQTQKHKDTKTQRYKDTKIQRYTTPPPRIRSNLMIEDGCEHYCTYCIVPYARGKVKSKPVEEIIDEAKKLIKLGAKEIVLTGINLGAYGRDKTQRHKDSKTPRPSALPQVIKDLSKIEGLLRIRLSSLEPMFITKELIDTIAKTPKVCPHLHIPLQSGDDSILKAMDRNYTAKNFLGLIKYIKKKIKGAAINTDIIVGFPGEGEKEFKNTIELADKIKFSRIHIFSYSTRKGTAAEKLKNKVPEKEIQKRYDELNELRTKYMKEFAEKYKDKEVEVLVECRDKKTGLLDGLTPRYIRVLFDGPDELIGKTAKVKIKEIKDEICSGKITG